MNDVPIEEQPLFGESVRSKIVLAVISGIMLGAAFLPSPFYTLAYVALIPFLFLMSKLDSYLQALRYGYISFFLFHLVSLYWVGGFTHARDPYLMASGTAILLLHPMFHWLPILGSFFILRHRGAPAALISFPFLWTAFEYVRSLSEFAFPWMTLGNSQAYDLYRIQLVEYTSVYGLSFLLVVFNSLAFLLLRNLGMGAWKFRSVRTYVALLALVLLYVLPWMYGRARVDALDAQGDGEHVNVGIVQPNVDPWEKWGEGYSSKWESYERQFDFLLAETETIASSTQDLIVWPETAIPFYLLLPQNESYRSRLQRKLDSVSVPVFTGLPHALYFDSSQAPATARRVEGTSVFVDSYNSATLLTPEEHQASVYKKIVLVPFAERIPYAETLRFLIEPLKWGVGISGWGKGADTTVFSLTTKKGDRVSFSGMICYESIFPDYVRHFTLKGAQFLVIITNDSWWGNTSGAYQHASFASFRAVENRRWIVRCANGGISALVDPAGRLVSATKMYTQATISGTISARGDVTFYARYGDFFAQLCLYCSGLFLIMSLLKQVTKRRNA